MKMIYDVESLIRQNGRVKFEIAGVEISFDLENRHERAYAARLLLNVKYPQADIDIFLFRRFLRISDTVLDAGANIGFTALKCLELGVKSVVAIEPLPALFERLERLSHPHVFPISKAISSCEGAADFFISTAHNQGSSLKQEMIEIFPSVFGEDVQKLRVELTTIDYLTKQFGLFDVWKLDIEGAEIDALKGASASLDKFPPRVIIAELYDKFFDDFYSLIKKSHPFVCRAFISKEKYEMELLAPVKGFPDKFHQTSPMYVFSRCPIDEL